MSNKLDMPRGKARALYHPNLGSINKAILVGTVSELCVVMRVAEEVATAAAAL